MAEKKKNEIKKSKLVEILTTEYKWENYFLAFFSLIATGLSLLLITKTLTIDPGFPVLGEEIYGNIFSWTLLVLSILGIIIIVYPFVKNSLIEVKKIEWPKWLLFLENLIRVVIFTVIITVVLFLFDMLLDQIFSWFTSMGSK
jgi:preprotein translocase subunit SecE